MGCDSNNSSSSTTKISPPPPKCSDMDSYDLGYSIARDQQGLATDCNYLLDLAKTQRDNINRTCFCEGVSDFRSNR